MTDKPRAVTFAEFLGEALPRTFPVLLADTLAGGRPAKTLHLLCKVYEENVGTNGL